MEFRNFSLVKQIPVKKVAVISPTVAVKRTTTTIASKSAQITPTKGAGKTTTTTKPQTGTVDKTAVTIEVQNGSGEAGVASKMSTYLKGLGY